MRLVKLVAVAAVGTFAYLGTLGVAEACTTAGTTVTCVGSGNTSTLSFTQPASGSSTPNTTVAPASTLNIPAGNGAGLVPAGATVSGVVLTLHNLTAVSQSLTYAALRDFGLLLVAPDGTHNLQVMSRIGTSTQSGNAISNWTLSLADNGAATFPGYNSVWTNPNGATFKPTNYDGTSTLRDLTASPDYGLPLTLHVAAPLTPSFTFQSAFAGAVASGDWKLYLASDGKPVPAGANITIGSWDLAVTYTAASSPSTTTVSPSLTNPFTSGAGSSVTLTANVTSGATGTVAFSDNGSAISGCGAVALSNHTAVCTTTFATEGFHSITAAYGGDSTFTASSGTTNIYSQNHAPNVGTTYCNTGAITSTGKSDAAFTETKPYPSVIFVGDGSVNTDITQTVSTVSLTLKNFSLNASGGLRMLLVSPDGKAFDFWDGVGSSAASTTGDYVLQDGGATIPQATLTPGIYKPTDNNPPLGFTPAPAAPAPQVPGTIVRAGPAGTGTFLTAFTGATSHGAWSLFLHNADGNGDLATVTGGWCLTISPNSGVNTTTTVTSSANPSGVFGASTSFTATIGSSPTPNQGTVTFTENGAPVAGAPNSGVANVSAGSATISTTGLSEGDHTITATYHDPAHAFNDSFNTVVIRIDKATSTPTLSGSTWSYCNTGLVTIPAGQVGLTDFGPASPNPTNIQIANLPGRVSSVTLTMKGFHHVRPQNLETLLVGPNGASAPTLAQTFDFFSLGGGINPIGPSDYTFGDAFAATPLNSAPSTSTGPASYGATSYTTSPFFTLPSGSVQHATSSGAFTFNTGTKTGSSGGVFLNTDPVGTWSMYFDQTTNAIGSGLDGGWCLNIIPTAVTGTGTTAHVGPASGNNMTQGGTGSVTFSLLNNGNGPTGDPDQAVAHAMTVTGTLPSGLTLGTVPTGSPWNCVANTTTQVTCTNLSAIAQGSTYPLLSIPVNVAGSAAASVTVSGFTFSGAGMTAGTFLSDSITINPAPVLSISKSHTGTFTQGQLGSESGSGAFTFAASNTSAGPTTGNITITDTLPTGWTAVGYGPTGPTGWSCVPAGSPSGNAFNCVYTQLLAGNGTAPTLTINVAVPATSPVSVNNQAKVFGGGDLVHTNSANGATSNIHSVTVVQVPNSFALGGINQTVQVNTAFPVGITAQVLDAGGVPIVGVNVTFTAPASGPSGTFAGATNTKTVATNGSGVAIPGTYTSNAIAGPTYQISVSAGSISTTFNATNIAGPATQMTANAGTTPQTASPTAAFAVPLAVTVKDAANNPVSGLSVLFTAPSANPTGTFSNAGTSISVITNASGVASAAFTASAVAGGPYNVTASAGALSATFSLTNATAPAVTVNPSDSTVNAGTTATFSAAASGAPTPTVQWLVSTDGGVSFSSISGATSTTLSLPNVSSTQDGTKYKATFTNGTGTATTTVATLTVNTPPTVTTNPVSQSVSAGVSVSFTAAATGKPTPTVQWQLSTNNGVSFSNIPGATSTTLTFVTSAGQNGNQFQAVFSNSVNSATTTPATLTVTSGPVVTLNPASAPAGCEGTQLSLTAAATGSPTPTVQWQVSTNGGTSFTDISGATSTTLNLGTLTASMHNNVYHAVFTNSLGTATTTNATLTVNTSPTTTLPANVSVAAGATATFTVVIGGRPTPSVQWQVSTDGGTSYTNVTGATSATLSFTAQLSQNGNKYRVQLTGSPCGSAISNPGTLTVGAPTITQVSPSSGAQGATNLSLTLTGSFTHFSSASVVTFNGTGITAGNPTAATSTSLTVPLTIASNAPTGAQGIQVVTGTETVFLASAFTVTASSGPVVTTNPTDVTINAGGTAVFTAAASGTPTPTVQWFASTDGINFTAISGATSTTLSVPGVTAGQNGNKFRAVFTNSIGTGTTTAATLNVNFAPTVTTNPISQSISAGSNVSFTVAASGNPTPTVQWFTSTDGGGTFVILAGATNPTLSFVAQTALNGVQYRAIFTNSVGTATTTAATLTVTAGPVVTTNPIDVTINAGGTAVFTAAASGTPTPTVQWFASTDGISFSPISGATTTTLTLPSVTAGQNGNKFRAVFTNASGTGTTTAATLTVNFAPTVTTNPLSQSINAGSNVSFTVAASGNPAPTVQWFTSTDGGGTFVILAGATNPTLSFVAQTALNGVQYRAIFTNSVGTATTTAATLTVTAGPVITTNPVNVSVNAGGTATFTAAASGTPTPTVQWFASTDGISFSPISGATTTTLTLPSVTAGQNGNKFRAVFTNASGTGTTTAATLTVNFAPTVTTNPLSQSINAGSNVSFTVAASGNPTPTVQWFTSSDGGATFVILAGATNPTLSFVAQTALNGVQYRAIFTNSVGTATTTAATLTVTVGPVITGNPVSTIVCAGTTVGFGSAATGTPTPTVQWQVSTNGGATFTDIPGATSPTLSLGASTVAMNGNIYHAVYTNSGGSATTNNATLTVNTAPTVSNPSSTSATAGSNAVFTVILGGQPTPGVQWQVSADNGVSFSNIPGATSATLSFAAAQSDNGKQFRAVVTSQCGTATSAGATLTVTSGPVITGNPVSTIVCAGTTVGFGSAASGTPTPTVQWQVSSDGGATFTNIPGATSPTLSLGASTTAMNGNIYHAVYTNSAGSATTNNATLTVNTAPTVSNPSSTSATVGSNAVFTVTLGGRPTPSVQWQVSADNGVSFSNIPGATSATLSFTVAQADNNKMYRAVATSQCGTATSAGATLTVTAGPVITLNPLGQTVAALQTATFTAAATGAPAPTVQWQVSTNGGGTFNSIPGATSTTLTFAANGTMNGNQYRAVFTNSAGGATTAAATLTVTKLTSSLTWANPADLPFGSALGNTQLNATSSVPGTFVYTPALGTVLPQGNGQTLSVVFTPTDSANYATASASVVINVVAPIVTGQGQFLVTNSLTRDTNTNEVIVTLTFANSGGTPLTNLVLTAASIGGVTPTTPALPANVASSVPGLGQTTIALRFPGSIGAPGARAVLSVTGAYDQGTISSGGRLVLP